jgi:orotidine-5'-phosphate decarboxylase
MTTDRLIVALDVPTTAQAQTLVARLDGAVSFYKIGLQLLATDGMTLARALNEAGHKTFLDWKLHDIPATVEKATAALADAGATFLTVHATPQVMAAAVKGRGASDMKILGVTVLTSLDQDALHALGHTHTPRDLVRLRVQQALDAGMDGVVASPEEAADIRAIAGDRLLIVTPGIRPAGADMGDQKRVATPASAIADGADYLVVGRPITEALDPKAAAAAIQVEIAAALSLR